MGMTFIKPTSFFARKWVNFVLKAEQCKSDVVTWLSGVPHVRSGKRRFDQQTKEFKHLNMFIVKNRTEFKMKLQTHSK